MKTLNIIGGGLAGSEAAWQAARCSPETRVRLWEMRPKVPTAVHQTGDLAELVCSNSLKSMSLDKASGLLKWEMRRFDSLILTAADEAAVPAGSALAVDRAKFAAGVTSRLAALPNIEIVREEATEILDGPSIVASGPLTSEKLAASIQSTLGGEFLNFFDAVAPVVDADTLNYDTLFLASRYEKGDAAYWNAALSEEKYDELRDAILGAELSTSHNMEDAPHFESCLPVEELAARGRLTLRYGALRGAGLTDPKTGRWPFACVQLRSENLENTMYNLVGFQTRLKWPEQTRILRLIPGLENVEILRYGVIHKNIFINSPSALKATFQTNVREDLFFAGQLTGVEGYIESAASGLMAGRNAAHFLNGEAPVVWPRETVLGSLSHYITAADPNHFQPMNSNWALLPPLDDELRGTRKKVPKDEKASHFVNRAQRALEDMIQSAKES